MGKSSVKCPRPPARTALSSIHTGESRKPLFSFFNSTLKGHFSSGIFSGDKLPPPFFRGLPPFHFPNCFYRKRKRANDKDVKFKEKSETEKKFFDLLNRHKSGNDIMKIVLKLTRGSTEKLFSFIPKLGLCSVYNYGLGKDETIYILFDLLKLISKDFHTGPPPHDLLSEKEFLQSKKYERYESYKRYQVAALSPILFPKTIMPISSL